VLKSGEGIRQKGLIEEHEQRKTKGMVIWGYSTAERANKERLTVGQTGIIMVENEEERSSEDIWGSCTGFVGYR
jgi:hypothetical protein